ncbi:hypothetical protein [Pukyongiella litopenaei]|uniref:Uncharacterized protein n=1 Tax=Pukyongiella litopenaei TaxID=2605946 RepID=A0A2S0ML61_9RHOB|nr:hypothetical protein [Pukyongiella litopenaei]AVO36620.1 hypothetical protein C6Y53_02170 [Pukyongiella litopenaei]
MLQQHVDQRKHAFETRLAANKLRLRNPVTGEFLHLSGQGVTHDINYSWLGFAYQAENLRIRAAARGESWPFDLVHRHLLTDDVTAIDHLQSATDGAPR